MSGMKPFPKVELPRIPERDFLITQFGAVGDGMTDNTEAIERAIAACDRAGGGRVVIPAGLWLTGPIVLRSRMELHAASGALVTFSRNFEQYPLIVSQFEGQPAVRCRAPIDGEKLEDIAITGPGVFDGSGDAWRPVKRMKLTASQWKQRIASGGVVAENAEGEIWWPTAQAMHGEAEIRRLQQEGSLDPAEYWAARDYLRPALVSLRGCRRLLLDGPTFQNSPGWCLHPWGSEHVTVRHTTVRNPWYSQNGDGLDIDSCRFVTVDGCSFDVGDDAICMKSGKDEAGRRLAMPCEYVTVTNCKVYHGHGGFVIGSEMSGGVNHIRVSDCDFMGTDIGLRFKSARGRGGIVEDIRIENIRMKDIALEAISFHLFYQGVEGSEGFDDREYPVDEGTPVFRKITMRNIYCAGASVGLLVNGLAEMPLSDCLLEKAVIQSERGILCRFAAGLKLRNIRLQVKEGPLASFHECKDVEMVEWQGETKDTSVNTPILVTGNSSANIKVAPLA
ncbi:glycoside hydrolase family 28 protein [Paenibacillus sp. LPE1-1-1.1]|uniref:glycoside hydrolase family 28 protein n=1 Tax=Paenibacillus sp. LPE1-1-1.1 TaxID=3135230 RepID=UPI003420691F